MFDLIKFMLVPILASLSTSSFATTAFSIIPLTTNTTVESVGQTAVRYTVINQAKTAIPNLSVVPNWHSSGVHLLLNNDHCSGQTLTQGESCTFDIAISGKNQSSHFTLQPKICGFNNQICSQSASKVNVNVVQHPLPLRLYEVIFPQDNSTEVLVGINIANPSDIIQTTLSNPSSDGPLAISPDGSKVYMSHNNGDSTYNVLVFSVTADSISQTQVSYNLSYEGHSLSNPGQIAITPDGNTLYITDRAYSGTGYPVYKVDLSLATVTGISDATIGGVAQNPKAIVVSPDGKTVYLSNEYSSVNNIFSFPNTSTTSINTIARETDMSTIVALLISSDGSTLYAAGQSNAVLLPAVIEQYTIAENFSINKTFATSDNGVIISASLSPNNAQIYSIVNDYVGPLNPLLYSINTATMTAPAGITFNSNVIFGVGNLNAIAYSPDGSAVSILNYGSTGHLTALFNPNTPTDVTTVNPADNNLTMYSRTWGSFIN